jgi:phage shock protein A|tara:strand:+ start:738 stop:1016 length:279 start_codon:yes stop_codon:yes gene_type:complete
MAQTDDARLDRIEQKIDKLADAMVSLARTEEKILAMEENHRNHYERMNRFSQKLDAIEIKVNENAHTVSIINKVTFVGVAAIIGAIVKTFWF